jgi:hypothetical protein
MSLFNICTSHQEQSHNRSKAFFTSKVNRLHSLLRSRQLATFPFCLLETDHVLSFKISTGSQQNIHHLTMAKKTSDVEGSLSPLTMIKDSQRSEGRGRRGQRGSGPHILSRINLSTRLQKQSHHLGMASFTCEMEGSPCFL